MNSQNSDHKINESALSTSEMNAREEFFVINKAGENASYSEIENTDNENPLILSDKPSEDLSSCGILDTEAIRQINLPYQIKWDMSGVSPVAIYQYSAVSDLILPIIMLIIILLAFSVAYIINEWLGLIVGIGLGAYLIGTWIYFYVRAFKMKLKYQLKITIHNDEIIMEESTDHTAHSYAFPRKPEAFRIRVTPILPKFFNLATVKFSDKNNAFSPERAFDVVDASDLQTFLTEVINANIPTAEKPLQRPYLAYVESLLSDTDNENTKLQ